MVKGVRIGSPYIFLSAKDAETAEAAAVLQYLQTGKILLTSSSTSNETIHDLLTRRESWLKEHRSPKHARETAYLFQHALKFAPEWVELPAPDLTADQVEEWAEKWAADLQARGKSRITVNKALVALQAAYNCPWGTRRAERKYPYNPFALTERFSVEHKGIFLPSDAQVKKVIKSAQGEGKLFLEFLKETGARPGEGLNTMWTDLSIHQKPYSVTLYTRKKKGGSRTPRRILIERELARKLRKWRNENPQTVFVFQQNGREAPHDKHWATDIQKDACEKAKVFYFTPHAWRHWHASKIVGKMNLVEIQKRLGHENASTTDKYIHSLVGV